MKGDRFHRKKLEEYSGKFCQRWNTWNLSEFSTETSSAKTFYLTSIGTWNWSILDLLQRKKTKLSVRHSVDRLLTQPHNFSLNQTTKRKLLTSGASESPFTQCCMEHCPLMERNSKTQKGISSKLSMISKIQFQQKLKNCLKKYSLKTIKELPLNNLKKLILSRNYSPLPRISLTLNMKRLLLILKF